MPTRAVITSWRVSLDPDPVSHGSVLSSRATVLTDNKEFAECSKQAGVKVLWQCIDARDEMNACILKLQKPEELDRQRRLLIEEKKEKLKNGEL